MGGVDKGLQLYQNQTLVAWSLARLRAQSWGTAQHIGISANRNLEQYAALGYPVWADARPGYHGPLQGVIASLQHATTWPVPLHYVFLVPCDTPHLPLDLAQRLSNTLAATPARLAAARANARTHPLACLLSLHVMPELGHYLDSGQRKVQTWMEACGVHWVDFDAPAYAANAFDNFNNLAELAAKPSDSFRPDLF